MDFRHTDSLGLQLVCLLTEQTGRHDRARSRLRHAMDTEISHADPIGPSYRKHLWHAPYDRCHGFVVDRFLVCYWDQFEGSVSAMMTLPCPITRAR